jgi:hypothetical protein
MPKVSLSEALAEKEEDDAITCKTCNAPADDEYAPYCMSCGIYWKDCGNGLYEQTHHGRPDVGKPHGRGRPGEL